MNQPTPQLTASEAFNIAEGVNSQFSEAFVLRYMGIILGRVKNAAEKGKYTITLNIPETEGIKQEIKYRLHRMGYRTEATWPGGSDALTVIWSTFP